MIARVLLVLLVMATAACGRSDREPRLLSDAVDRTVAGGSSKTSATFSSASGQAPVRVDGLYDFRSRQGRFTVPAPTGEQVELIISTGTLYANFGRELAPGKRWLRTDLEQAGALGISQRDPLGVLYDLRSATETRKLGAGIVRGVRATHYRAVVRQGRSPASIPVDVWIDSGGRVRRVSARNPAFVQDLYEFGVRADVRPPEDEAVMSIS